MVSNPHQFDVMLLPNLYGNIVSNIGAGLVGGAGLVEGMNVGWDHIVFEQGARHSFSSAAQQNVANPTGILLSSVSILRHLGCVECDVILCTHTHMHAHTHTHSYTHSHTITIP